MSNPNVLIDRNKYIGGSDLPNILGLNVKYGKSVFEFAKEKAGIIPNSFKGNQFTKYGQLMEPIIRDYINSIEGTNYLEDTVIDSERKYRGNTDGIDINADIPILEIKTFGEELNVDYYRAQCQFYMETFNQDKCLLVGYKRPKDFYTGIDYELENDDSYFNLEFNEDNIVKHVIERDKNLWDKINERIVAFKNVLRELKNNPDMTEDEFNSIFYGNELITISNKVIALENKLLEFKKVEQEHKKLKDQLYKLFEEKDIIALDTGNMKITKVNPISYDTVTVDVAKLQIDLPDLYEQYKMIKTTNKKGYILISAKKEVK